MFDKSKLDSLFVRIKRSENAVHENHYVVINDQGSHIAQLIFQKNGDLVVEVDNFPSQKKYFNSNIPIKTVGDFISDMQRIGLAIE